MLFLIIQIIQCYTSSWPLLHYKTKYCKLYYYTKISSHMDKVQHLIKTVLSKKLVF